MRLIRYLLLPFRYLYCSYALLLFIIGMLGVLPVVVICSVQEPKRARDNISKACYWWGWFWMTGIGIWHRRIEDGGPGSSQPQAAQPASPRRHPAQPAAGLSAQSPPGSSLPEPSRQYVFVANHNSYLDIPMIYRAMKFRSFRILGKAEMARIPLFGYIYRRAIVMVDRSTAIQRSRSVREMKAELALGASIFLFPEGTFNETSRPLKSFYDGAFRVAIETQTPLYLVLFLDGFDRMNYRSIFHLCPGRTRSVFLGTVEVQGLAIEDVEDLKNRVYHIMEEALIRYKVSWIA